MCYHDSMSYGKPWWIAFLFILVSASSSAGYFFYTTGGNGLARVIAYYLIRDLPDKEYSWRDFTDRGPTHKISGFYSSGNKDGFNLWTLSGLKKFDNVPGTSIYMYEDICDAVRELSENPDATEGPIRAPQQVTPDILTWEDLMKKEYFVTVKRLDEQANPNLVDKVWSYSGKYKIINQLDLEACN